MTNKVRKRRQYDPKHQYDDTALMKWLLEDQARADAKEKKKNKTRRKTKE